MPAGNPDAYTSLFGGGGPRIGPPMPPVPKPTLSNEAGNTRPPGPPVIGPPMPPPTINKERFKEFGGLQLGPPMPPVGPPVIGPPMPPVGPPVADLANAGYGLPPILQQLFGGPPISPGPAIGGLPEVILQALFGGL
jgi:hypothetical protein